MAGGAPNRGGIVVRVDGRLFFLPASLASRVAPIPRVAAIPGGPPELVGIAMHEGAVVPVVSVGSARTVMIICHHAGESVGLIGGEVIRTGLFTSAPEPSEAIEFEGDLVPPLDVAAICERVQSGARSGRWRG